ncbi:porin family protein [Flavobacterium myungsuense]|uniref:porin family protein n=1 Tax=Flavobacterium myungsuense TaxID=651823 RepID=UPI00362D65A9
MKNSKKHLTILLLLTLHFFTASAQGDIKLGVKGGVNFANLSSSDTQKNKVLTGINFGLFARVPLTKSFALQPEMYFTSKGSQQTYENAITRTAKFELNYIEVPIMLVFDLTNNFNFQLGPYASYLISSKVKNVSDISFNFEDNIDSGDFNKFDTGIAVGVGYDTKSIGFGIRYNLGLVTVGKEKTYLGTNYVFPDGKNGVINLFLSYSF